MLRAIVHEGARGEAEADSFCRLVEPEIDGAYRLAGYLLGNAADAQDAAQDAIAKAWTSFGSLRDRALFNRWFRRILVNGCRDRLRHRGVVRWVSLDTPDAPEYEAADPFAASLSRDVIGRALGVLSPDERSSVVLHYWADLGTAEIAVLLGIPRAR